ncbi:phasin family protein [Acidisoma silvae]|nr:phasin family protein [Acidisoma silvae]
MARRSTAANAITAEAGDPVQETVQAVTEALPDEAEAAASDVAAVASETAEETRQAVDEAVKQVMDAAKDSAAEISSHVEDTKLKFNQGMTNTMKTAEEMLAFSQGNVEAFIKSGQIWSAGLQDISKQMASSAQSSYEEAMAAFKALTSVKSLKEAVDLQVGLARSAMEKSVAESNKYTDASFKLAEQAIAPISGRMTMAAEKFGKTV